MAIELLNEKWCPYREAEQKEFLVDTDADVANLPECCPGSTALVAATGNVYIVNASGNWVEFGGEA